MSTTSTQPGSEPRGVDRSGPASAVAKAPEAAAFLRIKSILVPVDFSESSGEAFDYALAFARHFGAKLTLLHVVEIAAAGDFANTFPLLLGDGVILAGCQGRLETMVKEQGIDPGLIERIIVREGRSFHEITEAAEQLGIDLIIISTHGYTGLKHVLMGGTTERVVRHAPCPVLVVRQGEREFTRHEVSQPKK